MVSVERKFVPRFVDHAVGWHPAAAVKAIGVVFRTGDFVVSANHHFLMARASGKQEFVVEYAKGIAEQPALSAGAAAGQRIAIVTAGAIEVAAVRFIHAGIVIDVGDRVIRCRRHLPRDFFVFGHCGVAHVDLVRHETGIEVTANACHAAHGVADAIGIQTCCRGVTALIHQLRAAVQPLFVGVLRTQSGVSRPAIGDVVLAAPHAEFVFDIAVGPFLRVVTIVFRWRRHEIDPGNVDARFAAMESFLLIAHVQ
ncbi:hypothetical protein D3C72_505370 [compost metagenome]